MNTVQPLEKSLSTPTIPRWVKVLLAVGLLAFLIRIPSFASSLHDARIKHRAVKAGEAGQHELEAKLYQELHQRYPKDTEVTKNLALAQHKAGDDTSALATLKLLVGVALPKSTLKELNQLISDLQPKQ